jgi:hypothetical protein
MILDSLLSSHLANSCLKTPNLRGGEFTWGLHNVFHPPASLLIPLLLLLLESLPLRNISVSFAEDFNNYDNPDGRLTMLINFDLSVSGQDWKKCYYRTEKFKEEDDPSRALDGNYIWTDVLGNPSLFACDDLDDVSIDHDPNHLDYEASNSVSDYLINQYCWQIQKEEPFSLKGLYNGLMCISGGAYETYSLTRIFSLNFRQI